jgi:hypothetical protein
MSRDTMTTNQKLAMYQQWERALEDILEAARDEDYHEIFPMVVRALDPDECPVCELAWRYCTCPTTDGCVCCQRLEARIEAATADFERIMARMSRSMPEPEC